MQQSLVTMDKISMCSSSFPPKCNKCKINHSNNSVFLELCFLTFYCLLKIAIYSSTKTRRVGKNERDIWIQQLKNIGKDHTHQVCI